MKLSDRLTTALSQQPLGRMGAAFVQEAER